MHFTADINWGIARTSPLFSIPVPWISPSLHFRVSLLSLQNMQILLPNHLCLTDYKIILTTSAIGRWGRRKQRGPHLSWLIHSLIPTSSPWLTSLFLCHCGYSNTLSLPPTVLASSFPFEWSHRHEVGLSLCGVSVSYLKCYIIEIELSHFLDIHSSTLLSPPL